MQSRHFLTSLNIGLMDRFFHGESRHGAQISHPHFVQKTLRNARYYVAHLQHNYPIKRQNPLFDNDSYNLGRLHQFDK